MHGSTAVTEWAGTAGKLFDVEIDSDAHVLLAVKALEVNARFINLRLVISQRSLAHAALID
jgi:hypothetical protein